MARPSIRTSPVTVDTKQIPVDPTSYPLPSTLTPPPPEAPYTTVNAQQEPVQPIHSAMASALIGLALKQFQQQQAPLQPQPQPTFPPPPETHPAYYPPLQFSSQTPPPVTTEPPPLAPQQPPTPDSTLSGILSRTGQPLRDFTPPPAAAPPAPAQPTFGEPPATKTYSPPQQILASIGIPQAKHQAIAPIVARTFPQAVEPKQSLHTPPKALRTTQGTVASTLDRVSPMRQNPAPTGRKIVVSLPDKKVVVYDKDGSILREYSAYIGRASSPTPRGQFRIMENIKPAESEWYYGGHWLGFARGYKQEKNEVPYAGFHGWVYDKSDDEIERNDPGWKTSTGGCIQLGNKDVADLASLVAAGDPVSILDTPFAPPPPKPPLPQMRPQPAGFLQNLMGR